MNQEDFVIEINHATRETVVEDCVKNYLNPPGRSPAKRLLELSAWFKGLSVPDQEMVAKAMADVAEATLFGVLCVLDGVRTIEDDVEKGKLELYYTKGELRVRINDPDQDFLHDIYSRVRKIV